MTEHGAITIPGYTLLHSIGTGGMAEVYLATQDSLGRQVALKILSPAMAADPVLRERFLQEARIAAQLHHPNIIAIYDVGTADGTAYIASIKGCMRASAGGRRGMSPLMCCTPMAQPSVPL